MDHGAPRDPAPTGTTRTRDRLRAGVAATVAAVAVLSVAGMALLWPTGEAPDLGARPGTYVDAEVTSRFSETCESLEAVALTTCEYAGIRITSGPDTGSDGVVVAISEDLGLPSLEVGDRIVVLDVPTSPPPYRYSFTDFQRSTPLWLLAGLFVVVVLVFARWQGLRAILGLLASVLILVAFLVPALIRGEPAVLTALVACGAIAVLALYLAHGFNVATTVALAGTLVSLLVIALLAVLAASAAELSGLADEQAQVLRVTAGALDLRGLLVAGIVVGALGVLDDVTVTQVSTVAALRRANPDLGPARVYAEAIRVGRDHIASTVNTLVLAYAGAALPLMLLFSQGGQPVTRILTSEIVAVEVVRMLVGSIGLVLSVPITTGLAAFVLREDDDVPGHDHGHAVADVDRDAPAPGDDLPSEGSAAGDDSLPNDSLPNDSLPDDSSSNDSSSNDRAWQRFAPRDEGIWDDS